MKIGDKIKVCPAFLFGDSRKLMEGEIDYINFEHRWVDVKFICPGGQTLHEGFKIRPKSDHIGEIIPLTEREIPEPPGWENIYQQYLKKEITPAEILARCNLYRWQFNELCRRWRNKNKK